MLDQEANHPPVEFVGILLYQKTCILEYNEALNLDSSSVNLAHMGKDGTEAVPSILEKASIARAR